MSETVTVHYADFCGNTYHYTMPERGRKWSCDRAKVPDFDIKAFRVWFDNWSSNTELAMHDDGYINLRAVSRIWYTVVEVH